MTRPRILVCDDSKTIRALMTTLLSNDYELLTCESGEQALAQAEGFEPDLIISDLLMTGMDGAELCQRMKQVASLARIPFVLLTSKTDEESRVQGLEAGADDYLFKPLRPREIKARVNSLLRLRFANLELETQKAELERVNEKLERLALEDGLTGLYNHRSFQERLREEIARARRHGRPLSLLLLDLDHFKQLNDRFGHLAGDEALRAVAAMLRGELDPAGAKRTSDIAARYGGEELVVLLPETNRHGGLVKARRLVETVSRIELPNSEARITVSVGVAEYPGDALEAQELIQRADEALYQAKRNGRNRAIAQGQFPREGEGTKIKPFTSFRGSASETVDVLRKQRYLAAYCIDLPELARIEREYGNETLQSSLRTLVHQLQTDGGGVLFSSDIITLGESGTSSLIVFLNRPDRGHPPRSDALEAQCQELAKVVQNVARATLHTLVPRPMRVAVGYAVGLDTRQYSHDRQIELLVREASLSARTFREKQNERQKVELQWMLLEERLDSLYQPVVTADGKRIIGYEALVRGPEGSSLASPQDLLHAAALADLDWELDRGCVKSAFRSAKLLPEGTTLSVNVLPSTLYDRELSADWLIKLINDSGLSPDRVVLEVTEQNAISNLERFRDALAPLVNVGIKIALDDVGVANANLEQISTLLPNYLKLDRVIVDGVAVSRPKYELVRSMVAVAASINAKVVAEGVEQTADWECLKSLGVDYLQGFLFARPGPAFPSVLGPK
jgi:diguanylate cyclase (GGDEF)-like protein